MHIATIQEIVVDNGWQTACHFFLCDICLNCISTQGRMHGQPNDDTGWPRHSLLFIQLESYVLSICGVSPFQWQADQNMFCTSLVGYGTCRYLSSYLVIQFGGFMLCKKTVGWTCVRGALPAHVRVHKILAERCPAKQYKKPRKDGLA